MKKMSLLLCRLLFAMVVLYPVGVTLCACFGYRFILNSVPGFSAAMALLAMIVVLFFKVPSDHKTDSILAAMLLPLSLLNAVFYFFACSKITVVFSCFVTIASCCILTIKHGKPFALKVVALVLSALMIVPVGFLGFISLMFGNIGQNTVVKTVDSPDGTCYAQVIDSDQGALGGDTIVAVHEKRKLNAILFTIEKKPQDVYFGDWGEFRDMEIYWKDEHCLVINSVEYEIK